MRIALTFFAFVSFLFACKGDLEEVDKVKLETSGNVEVGFDVEIIYNEDLSLRARLLSDEMVTYVDRKNSVEFPVGLEILVYNKSGVIDNHIWADYGYILREEEKILAKENVRLENIDGETMKTDEITWDRRNKKLFCADTTFVEYYTGEEVIEGYGMIADEDFTDVEILNVTGIINVDEDFDLGR